jgi:hypothetical protein
MRWKITVELAAGGRGGGTGSGGGALVMYIYNYIYCIVRVIFAREKEFQISPKVTASKSMMYDCLQ